MRRELTDLQKSYTKTVEQHAKDLHLLVTTVAKQQQEMEKLSKVAIGSNASFQKLAVISE